MDNVPVPPSANKTCSTCGLLKPVNQYHVKIKATGRLFSWCKDCHRNRKKATRAKNPAKYSEMAMAWQRSNPEKTNGIQRRTRAKNAEKISVRQKAYDADRRDDRAQYRLLTADHRRSVAAAYRLEKKEILLRKGREYYLANRISIIDRMKRYVANHPEIYRPIRKAANHRRKARLLNNGPVEKFLDAEIFDRDGWMCHLCGNPVDRLLPYPDPMSVSLDHVKPIANGGGHTRANVACAHLRCNLQKRNLYERRPVVA